jgi:hypothetical protein
MIVTFHIEAQHELEEAIDYYESLEAGLGYRLASEVESTVHRV